MPVDERVFAEESIDHNQNPIPSSVEKDEVKFEKLTGLNILYRSYLLHD
jgi:hypothetical protein